MATDQPTLNMSPITFLGAGYTAKTFMRLYPQNEMYGTTRSSDKASDIKDRGGVPLIFDGTNPSDELINAVKRSAALMISISPTMDGDPILNALQSEIISAEDLNWVGYLSTIGVYGNYDGAWIDEDAATNPLSERSKWRKDAEQKWLDLQCSNGVPVHIFRLPGIYGPGRGPLSKLQKGTAQRIAKEGQVFNRAHVDDIAAVLYASMQQPNPGRIYNVADNEPAPPQDVLEFAANELGIPVPPLINFESAEMTPMARSFYLDNKRVSNKRIKEELGVSLKYPTYREGIRACIS